MSRLAQMGDRELALEVLDAYEDMLNTNGLTIASLADMGASDETLEDARVLQAVRRTFASEARTALAA